MDYLLFYKYAPDYLKRRDEFRAEHLTRAWAVQAKGELVLAGALAPPDRAIFHFVGDSPTAAEAFARSDPYVLNGLVESWEVRQWNTVVGVAASNPIHPDTTSP